MFHVLWLPSRLILTSLLVSSFTDEEMGSLPQGHRGWRKRRCGPLPWGHWQGGRVSDYPHAQQRTASKALPTGPGAEAAWLPHCLAFTPSISEFIGGRGQGLRSFTAKAVLGALLAHMASGCLGLAWFFWGAGLSIAQLVRGGASEAREEAEI